MSNHKIQYNKSENFVAERAKGRRFSCWGAVLEENRKWCASSRWTFPVRLFLAGSIDSFGFVLVYVNSRLTCVNVFKKMSLQLLRHSFEFRTLDPDLSVIPVGPWCHFRRLHPSSITLHSIFSHKMLRSLFLSGFHGSDCFYSLRKKSHQQ